MTTRISYAISFLTSLGMIFLGARFLLSPEAAEAGYGIHFNEQGDYSFHYIKDIRDIFSGLLISVFVLMNQRLALGVTLLAGTMIPITDMLIVLSKSYNGVLQAILHIIAIIICAVLGLILLETKPMAMQGLTKDGRSRFANREHSILEFSNTEGYYA